MTLRPRIPPEGGPDTAAGLAERLERAATLLLAASGLALAALVGWGGLVLDLGPLAPMLPSVYHAITGGKSLTGGPGDPLAGLGWRDLGPLLGTGITLLFWWHAVA